MASANLSSTTKTDMPPFASSNTTESTSKRSDYFNPGTPIDLAADALLIIALITSLYLLISLSVYEWKIRRIAIEDRTTGSRHKSKSYIKVALRVLCILSAFFCCLRCINDIVYYKGQASSHIPCTVLKNIGGR